MLRGRKYMYICVVKRLGTLVGVIQRVKGIKASVSWSVLGRIVKAQG